MGCIPIASGAATYTELYLSSSDGVNDLLFERYEEGRACSESMTFPGMIGQHNWILDRDGQIEILYTSEIYADGHCIQYVKLNPSKSILQLNSSIRIKSYMRLMSMMLCLNRAIIGFPIDTPFWRLFNRFSPFDWIWTWYKMKDLMVAALLSDTEEACCGPEGSKIFPKIPSGTVSKVVCSLYDMTFLGDQKFPVISIVDPGGAELVTGTGVLS